MTNCSSFVSCTISVRTERSPQDSLCVSPIWGSGSMRRKNWQNGGCRPSKLATSISNWQVAHGGAFGAPTPQDWFELSKQDLSVLPRLKQAVVELLEELPWRVTGVGATETQILEFIAEGGLMPGEL